MTAWSCAGVEMLRPQTQLTVRWLSAGNVVEAASPSLYATAPSQRTKKASESCVVPAVTVTLSPGAAKSGWEIVVPRDRVARMRKPPLSSDQAKYGVV